MLAGGGGRLGRAHTLLCRYPLINLQITRDLCSLRGEGRGTPGVSTPGVSTPLLCRYSLLNLQITRELCSLGGGHAWVETHEHAAAQEVRIDLGVVRREEPRGRVR